MLPEVLQWIQSVGTGCRDGDCHTRYSFLQLFNLEKGLIEGSYLLGTTMFILFFRF